jgi:hypothetical protein
MNASLLPLFGATQAVRALRALAARLQNAADVLEANRALTPAQKAVLRRNLALKDRHRGQRAFVIVNGPSLAGQDILKLRHDVTFAVSGFWKHEAVKTWQPTYYSLLDTNFFTDTEATRTFYANLARHIHASTFFAPLFRGHDFVRRTGLLPFERTHFVACTGEVAGNDLTGIVQSFMGVAAFALSQAIYMGCGPIYLLGFDHDYLANRGVDRHFYAGGTIPGHKDTLVPLADRVPYDDEMRANMRLWANYRVLKAAAQEAGVEVFNATRGGYLDVFPRADYDALEFPA